MAELAKLTRRQAQVLEYIKAHLVRYQRTPTTAQIGAALGITTPRGAWCHVRALERAGYITLERGKHASIQLVGYRVQLVKE